MRTVNYKEKDYDQIFLEMMEGNYVAKGFPSDKLIERSA